MTRYAVNLFDRDSHIGEAFDSLEEAALWLHAWAKGDASLPQSDALYVIIRPYRAKEEVDG